MANHDGLAVSAAIRAAFAATQRDDSCTLHQAELLFEAGEQGVDAREWQAAARQDTERRWEDLPLALADAHLGALCALTPAGWRYYLPVFLLRAQELLCRPVWETGLPGGVLFNLTYCTENPEWCRRILARFELLDDRQQHAVKAFLRFVCDNPGQEEVHAQNARLALASYWDLAVQQRPKLASSMAELRKPGLRLTAPAQRPHGGSRDPAASPAVPACG